MLWRWQNPALFCAAGVSLSCAGHEDSEGLQSPSALLGGSAPCEAPPLVAFEDRACAGMLIHSRIVVYPAHCGFPSSFSISGDGVAVTSCVAAPQFDRLGRDLAYCILSEDARALAIPPLNACEANLVQPGHVLQLKAAGEPYEIEQMAEVTIERIEDVIEVGAPGVGACPGDSGGGAYTTFESEGARLYRSVGFISSGPPGCVEGRISLTPLAAFVSWIESSSGFDITPCGTAEGGWAPTPLCTVQRYEENSDCSNSPPVPWSLCGRPEEMPSVDGGRPPEVGNLEFVTYNGTAAVLVEVLHGGAGVRVVNIEIRTGRGDLVWSRSRSVEPFVFRVPKNIRSGDVVSVWAIDYADNESSIRTLLVEEPPPPVASCAVSRVPPGGIGVRGSVCSAILYILRRRRLKRRMFVQYLGFLLLLLALGCSDCNDAGCLPGLQIDLADQHKLGPGTILRFELDERRFACNFEGNPDDRADCGDAGIWLTFDSGVRLHQIYLPDQYPEHVAVTIDVAGDQVLSASAKPMYADYSEDTCSVCRRGIVIL